MIAERYAEVVGKTEWGPAACAVAIFVAANCFGAMIEVQQENSTTTVTHEISNIRFEFAFSVFFQINPFFQYIDVARRIALLL